MGDAGAAVVSASNISINSTDQLFGALVPAGGIAIVLFTAFLLARRYLPQVYDPKRERLRLLANIQRRELKGAPKPLRPLSEEHVPPEPPLLVSDWMRMLWNMPERDLIVYVGTDAYMFLRFLRMGCLVCVGMCVIGLGILMPIYDVSRGNERQLERISLSNMPEGSRLMWSSFAATYAFSIAAMILLYREYEVFVDLRQRYLMAPAAQSYSLLVRDIPLRVARDEVCEYLCGVLGEDVMAVHTISTSRKRKYDKLLEKRDEAIIKLTRALEYYKRTGVRPRHRPIEVYTTQSRLGIMPPSVDSIEEYMEQIQELSTQLAVLQEEGMDPGSSVGAIVTVDSIRVANAFKCIPFQQDVRKLRVSEAPPVEDVIWDNLNSYLPSRIIRSILVWMCVCTLILGYTVPVSFVASIANLRGLANTKGLEWLQPIVEHNPTLTSFIQGFLPPLFLSVFFSYVPAIMKTLTRMQRAPSHTDAENGGILKVYLFTLLDILLAYTIAGAFFAKLDLLVHLAGRPVDLVELLAKTLPAQSTFFITYIMVGTFSYLPFELLRVWALLVAGVRSMWTCHTTRGIWDELSALVDYRGFHELYSFPLAVYLAAVCFSVVAPLILPFAALYFFLAYVTWAHQLLYVYQPRTHTGASQWPVVFGCCVIALLLHQTLVLGILSLKDMPVPASLIAPLLGSTAAYGVQMNSAFRRVCEASTVENLQNVDTQPMDEETLRALPLAYDPMADLRRGEDEISGQKLRRLTEPYGVLYSGLLSEHTREELVRVLVTPTGKRRTEAEQRPEMMHLQRPSGGEYGATKMLATRGEGPELANIDAESKEEGAGALNVEKDARVRIDPLTGRKYRIVHRKWHNIPL